MSEPETPNADYFNRLKLDNSELVKQQARLLAERNELIASNDLLAHQLYTLIAAAKRVVNTVDQHDAAHDDLEATFIISGLLDALKAAIAIAKAEQK